MKLFYTNSRTRYERFNTTEINVTDILKTECEESEMVDKRKEDNWTTPLMRG